MAPLGRFVRSVGAGILAGATVFLSGTALAACPGPLPSLTEAVVLEVSSPLACAEAGQPIRLDVPMLEAMGPITLTTTTIWTEGVQEFRGVPLRRLLEQLGAEGETIDAWAVNDYWAEFVVPEMGEDWPIVAFLHNGKPMARRDKGPLWVIYPYDKGPEFNTEDNYARSIWQLERMEVLP